ncbi:MAG: acyltransferase family protein [Terriglobia bacterium]
MSVTVTAIEPPKASAATFPKTEKTERYIALDAFRGFIMLLLASGGLGFGALQNDPTYGGIAAWFDHVEWAGAVFWDLIQPSFMFMVGVAMPFALAIRTAKGATPRDNLKHVAVRALKLILLSQFLIIAADGHPRFQLINVLAQIAFTYFFAYLIMQMQFRWQVVTAAALLAFHSALFFLFPGPDGPFSKEGNIGAVIDKALLGYNYEGYYVTINFITSTVTTLFGAWAGMLLRMEKPFADKVRILAVSAVAAFAGGLAMSLVIPNVKRLWTASWTLYSTGWVLLMMIGFVLLIDVAGYKKIAFPLVVVGMNSIFIYSCGFLIRGSIDHMVRSFTGGYRFIGPLAPVAQSCTVLLVLWYLCYWLYKHKIFIKV